MALDNNSSAIDHVKRRVLQRGIKNVDVVLADALHTGLPDGSFDVAFLYGVIHNLRDQIGALLPEKHRVLNIGGILSISKSSRIAQESIIRGATETGLFRLEQKTNRVMNFERRKGAARASRSPLRVPWQLQATFLALFGNPTNDCCNNTRSNHLNVRSIPLVQVESSSILQV